MAMACKIVPDQVPEGSGAGCILAMACKMVPDQVLEGSGADCSNGLQDASGPGSGGFRSRL